MEDNGYKLCGGVFFLILCQIKRKGKSASEHYHCEKDDVTEPTMLSKLLFIVDDEKHMDLNRAQVSKYKSCKANSLSYFDWTNEIQNGHFDREIKSNYLQVKEKMQKFINFSLKTNQDGYKWCVSALLKILKDDETISDKDVFYYNNRYLTKEDLLNLDAYDFTAFLLAIFHFIVMNRPTNTIGDKTADDIKSMGSDFADKDYFKLKIETVTDDTENNNPQTETQTTMTDGSNFEQEEPIEAEEIKERPSTQKRMEGNQMVFIQNGNNNTQIGSVNTLVINHGDKK